MLYLAPENDESEDAGDDQPLGVESHPCEVKRRCFSVVVRDELLKTTYEKKWKKSAEW